MGCATLFFFNCRKRDYLSNPHIANNILNRGAGGRAAPVPSLSEVVLMSTYEELQLIVSVATGLRHL